MTRTVVPPPPGESEGGDDFPTALVKYVPAETLAFFVPAAAGIGRDRSALLILVVVVGAIGTLGYLWLRAQAEPDKNKRPLLHFYVLAVIAFLVWAIGTAPSVAQLAHLDEVAAGVVLGTGVFLIPLADRLLTRRP